MKAHKRHSILLTVVYVSLFLAHNGHALVSEESTHLNKIPEETLSHKQIAKKSRENGDYGLIVN